MEPGALCPEYVLVAAKVVYVISGKTSEALIPLAEVTRFRLQKNEMLIRIDDAPKESRFHIKAMLLRPEWDRAQQYIGRRNCFGCSFDRCRRTSVGSRPRCAGTKPD